MIEIVINPSGASGRTLNFFNRKVKPLFESSGEEFRIHYSTLDHDLDAILKEITEDGEKHTIVITGGDGSMNIAVNGLKYPDRNLIGFIPAGSGNDLAKALGITRDPDIAVKNILSRKVLRKLDLCEAVMDGVYDQNGRLLKEGRICRKFNISCGAGFDAEICAKAGAGSKSFLNKIGLGKLIYIATALKVIFSVKMIPANIRKDSYEQQYEKMLLAVVMNTSFEGGGFRFCPEADGMDGKLDFCIGSNLGRLDFFRIFPYAYSGAHVRFKGVETGRIQRLTVDSDEPLWIHTDGEVPGRTKHLEVYLTGEQLQMIN